MSEDPSTVEITDQNFASEISHASHLVVVEFWAVWSSPGRLLDSGVQQLASEYAGKVVIGRLDVDNNQRTAQQYGVTSIPTILFFRNGKVVERLVGAVPRQVLKSRIDSLL